MSNNDCAEGIECECYGEGRRDTIKKIENKLCKYKRLWDFEIKNLLKELERDE